MAARYGQVIYWVACLLAAQIVLYGVLVLFGNAPLAALIPMVLAGLIWLAGRAVLYVLAGR